MALLTLLLTRTRYEENVICYFTEIYYKENGFLALLLRNNFFVTNETEIIFFPVFRFSDKLIMKGRNGDVINLFHFYLSSGMVEFEPIYHLELSLCQEYFNKFRKEIWKWFYGFCYISSFI